MGADPENAAIIRYGDKFPFLSINPQVKDVRKSTSCQWRQNIPESNFQG